METSEVVAERDRLFGAGVLDRHRRIVGLQMIRRIGDREVSDVSVLDGQIAVASHLQHVAEVMRYRLQRGCKSSQEPLPGSATVSLRAPRRRTITLVHASRDGVGVLDVMVHFQEQAF
jgi:hypothetical protein